MQEAYELTQRMRAVQDQYTRLDMRAPVSGVVVNMAAHTVGNVIATTMPGAIAALLNGAKAAHVPKPPNTTAITAQPHSSTGRTWVG